MKAYASALTMTESKNQRASEDLRQPYVSRNSMAARGAC